MRIPSVLREKRMAQDIARPVERFGIAMIADFEGDSNVRFPIEMDRFEFFVFFQLSMFELQTGRAAP